MKFKIDPEIFATWPSEQIRQLIEQAVKELGLPQTDFSVEHPADEMHGDYSSNVALQAFGELKSARRRIKFENPRELAKKITDYCLQITNYDFIDKIQLAGPGFINFYLKQNWLIQQLSQIIQQADQYGRNQSLKGKKIMVEFAHPNTHKLFHVGHLRNIINGESAVRLFEAVGAQVVRANYQGDVGLHIAKCLWAIKQQVMPQFKDLDDKIDFLGKAYVKGNQAFEKDSSDKAAILKINKQIYQEDSDIKDLWQQTRQWSLDYFERIYQRVYSHFDRYYFESQVAQPGKEIVLQALKKSLSAGRRSIFVKSKGAIIFPGSKYGLHDRVFITAEGNPTYEAKDMELGRLQFAEHNPDLIVHNVGPEQSEYFKVIFKALEQIFPQTKGKEEHLMYGWVKLKKGKMSSRLGNIVLGEWLLDEAKKRLQKNFPDLDKTTAEIVAVGAVKYSFLKVNPASDIAFDFDESISLQGNSGPYLQYTYARCKSVLEKNSMFKCSNAQKSYEPNSEELTLLRYLYRYPEVVLQAAQELAPNQIANYLYELAQRFNAFYNRHRILANAKLKKQNAKSNFRLALTVATAQILKNGLDLLGIKAPEKM